MVRVRAARARREQAVVTALTIATVVTILGLSGGARDAHAQIAPPPAPPRNHVDLNATLDPAARRITGTVRLTVPNVSDRPLGEVSLWLYPNRLGDRPEALGDVNFHWLYPRGFRRRRCTYWPRGSARPR